MFTRNFSIFSRSHFSKNIWKTAQLAFTCSKSTIVILELKVWHMFKVNNKTSRTTRRHWLRSGVFIVNLEHIPYLFLLFLLLILTCKCHLLFLGPSNSPPFLLLFTPGPWNYGWWWLGILREEIFQKYQTKGHTVKGYDYLRYI